MCSFTKCVCFHSIPQGHWAFPTRTMQPYLCVQIQGKFKTSWVAVICHKLCTKVFICLILKFWNQVNPILAVLSHKHGTTLFAIGYRYVYSLPTHKNSISGKLNCLLFKWLGFFCTKVTLIWECVSLWMNIVISYMHSFLNCFFQPSI